jgi:LPS-assembly protein
MTRAFDTWFGTLLLMVIAAPAAAQQPNVPYELRCVTKEVENEHYRCKGDVVFVQGDKESDTKVWADELEWFKNEDRAIAIGNVHFTQGRNQITADRAEFNTKTSLGKFYTAQGIATSRTPRPTASTPGMFSAPQMPIEREADVYFYGDIVEKLGPKKYRITNGGFTTCVQPTPRWEFHTGSMTYNVDDYALLWNTAFYVKGVPLLYLPVLYYPTNEEQRSTGFLIPTYGASSFNGQTISNQFFWAISRSQDATFMHDWFSKLGQGTGAEYRYNIGSGSGRWTSYWLDPSQEAVVGGVASSEKRSFFLTGSANQALPGRFRASANANYFSSLSTNQRFKTDISELGQSERRIGANVAGAWGRVSLNATYRRSEWFHNPTSSAVTGGTPQISLHQGERALFSSSPVYFGFSSEYAHLNRETINNEVVTDDRTLTRIDFSPRLRFPLKRWQWITIDSSLAWRDTFYSRSQDPTTLAVLDAHLNRQFFTLQTDVKGPVFNRVWDTPDNGYAEKFKHSIEPFFTATRTTAANDFGRVVGGIDNAVVGDSTRYTYGINNRLHAKRTLGQSSQSQEIASLNVRQTYYTDARAALVDAEYGTSFTGTQPSSFSPLRADLRLSPTSDFSGTLTAEIDPTYRELRTLAVRGTHRWARGSTDVAWNQRFLVENLTNFNDPASVTRTLTLSSTARTQDNKLVGTYALTFDAVRSTILQQRLQGYYSAQCCGVSVQYSRTTFFGSAFPQNNTFQISVTLAGLGSVSPFAGGLGPLSR